MAADTHGQAHCVGVGHYGIQTAAAQLAEDSGVFDCQLSAQRKTLWRWTLSICFGRATQLEPRAEFDSLLSGLRNVYEPEGRLEEFLMDELASEIWRHRRVIIALEEETGKGRDLLGLNVSLGGAPSFRSFAEVRS
jgi:hypothetical protein